MNRQRLAVLSVALLIPLLSGVIFGLGLAVSQMINPAKVLAFLDVAGAWDPSLALVMASALLVMGVAWRLQRRRVQAAAPAGLSAQPDGSAAKAGIDTPLTTGAVIFGAGWGLVGFCPGPALAALALFRPEPLVFVAAMLAGMQLHRAWQSRDRDRDSEADPGADQLKATAPAD